MPRSLLLGILLLSLANGVFANRYIVVFRPHVRDVEKEARALAHEHGGSVRHLYRHAMKGFSVEMNEARARALAHNPNVAFVDEDQLVTIDDTRAVDAWGLDRIDQRDLPLDGHYTVTPNGAGVRVFVVDSGIRRTHQELAGRVSSTCYDGIGDGNGCNDCNGHGTHVAGTIGGATVGVANGVELVPVRVFGCGRTTDASIVIAGLDWVASQVSSAPAIVNMSLGTGVDPAMDEMVAALTELGVTVVVSSGNGYRDACMASPARAPSAITVGATSSNDTMRASSNYGRCVDLLAPGSSIRSSYVGGDDSYAVLSGTSMAAPHVAGVAALYRSMQPAATPADVTASIIARTTPNRLWDLPIGTPNLLLHSGCAQSLAATLARSGTTLTVTASGDGPLRYAWFSRSARGEWTPIAATSSSLIASEPLFYKARVTNVCGDSVETNEVRVLAAPANVVATANAPTSVQVTWSAVEGAASYEIVRGEIVVGVSNTTSFTDTSCAAMTSYRYRVRAAGGPLSAPDLATTIVFAELLVAEETVIKAGHWMELRNAINAVRALDGFAPFAFAPTEFVRAADLHELRAALNLPPLTDDVIRASHLVALRNAVR